MEKLLGSMAVEARKRREAMVPADKSKAAPVEKFGEALWRASEGAWQKSPVKRASGMTRK